MLSRGVAQHVGGSGLLSTALWPNDQVVRTSAIAKSETAMPWQLNFLALDQFTWAMSLKAMCRVMLLGLLCHPKLASLELLLLGSYADKAAQLAFYPRSLGPAAAGANKQCNSVRTWTL